jgi:hypothetical protein
MQVKRGKNQINVRLTVREEIAGLLGCDQKCHFQCDPPGHPTRKVTTSRLEGKYLSDIRVVSHSDAQSTILAVSNRKMYVFFVDRIADRNERGLPDGVVVL